MRLKALDEKKIEILDKLAQAGADTEKKMTALDTDEIFDIMTSSNIMIQDMHLITDFQKAVKRRKLYSFITGGVDEKEENDGNRGNTGGNGTEEEHDEDLKNGVEGSGTELDGRASQLY